MNRISAEQDKYIIDNFHIKHHTEIMKDLDISQYWFYTRVNQLVLDERLSKDPLVMNWYNYLNQLTNIARDYRTTHRGMWAKSLLEDIFKEDYEDVS